QSEYPRCSPTAVWSSSMPEKTRIRSGLRAAGDVQHLTADVAGVLAGEERDRMRDVGGLTNSRHRGLRGDRVLEVLVVDVHPVGGRLGHLRLDEARTDHVRRDAELAELDRERLGHALQTGLGGRVVGLAAVAQR